MLISYNVTDKSKLTPLLWPTVYIALWTAMHNKNWFLFDLVIHKQNKSLD